MNEVIEGELVQTEQVSDIVKIITPGFVVLTHFYSSNEQGKKVVNETCEFVDKVKNRHKKQATAILDFQKLKIVKTRVETTFEEYENYLRSAYPEKFAQFLQIIGL